MTTELLDKNKVIEAIRKSKNNMYFGCTPSPSISCNVLESLNDSMRQMILEESKKIILEAFESFVTNLTIELEDCEPDKYPCALCCETEQEKINE